MRWIAAIAFGALAVSGCALAAELDVSSQGLIVDYDSRLRATSPRGTCTIEIARADMSDGMFVADLVLIDQAGRRRILPNIPGSAFLPTDAARIVSIGGPDTEALPATVRILDLEGRELTEWEVAALSDPAVSPDGTRLTYRDRDGIVVLDLSTLESHRYPHLAPYALGPGEKIAGARPSAEPEFQASGARRASTEIVVIVGGCEAVRAMVAERPRRFSWTEDGRTVLVATRTSVLCLDVASGQTSRLMRAPAAAEIRDIRSVAGVVVVGLRETRGAYVIGRLVALDPDGRVLWTKQGPRRAIATESGRERPEARGIPWPLAPDAQHPIGNTYGEYQWYGGDAYLHPGIDVMGSAGQPVYAVAPGVVKAVLTTSGIWHWRVAVADSPTAETCPGYLYAHLDEPTITVDVGDTVVLGQYLGDLVEWPVADFHHVHFARIEDSGDQWYGDWLSISNPQLEISSQSETTPPEFEPARGSDLLAFCVNETSDYLDPDALYGQVDIIAHVGDRIASNWVCTAQEIRYTIYPVGYPEFPVVDDKLAAYFDMVLDTYVGGPIDPFLVDLLYKQDTTCPTQGNYDAREFYHIITNSDGNQVYEESDLWQAWDTTELPDAQYVVRVWVRDVAGNAAADSMIVTTANGNPTFVPYGEGTLRLFAGHPNPARETVTLDLWLPSPEDVTLSIYDVGGRLVRTLVDGPRSEGPHRVVWNGRDSRGNPVASGTYFARLSAGSGTADVKLAVVR